MTQEDKEILLKDLCSRLPYGLKGQVQIQCSDGTYDVNSGHLEYTNVDVDVELFGIQEQEITVYPIDSKYNDVISDYSYTYDEFMPYLRPLTSMTEEEKEEFESLGWRIDELDNNTPWNHNSYNIWPGIDWLNAHHFDYRGLIEKGLAIKAPEGMYE